MFPGGPGMIPGGPGPRPDWGGGRSMRRGGGDQGSGWGRSSGGSPDQQDSRSQRYEAFLRQFDANGDGLISPNEVSGSRRSFYDSVVRRAGLDPAGPVSLQALRDALSQRGSGRSGGPPGGMQPPGPGWGGQPDGGKPSKETDTAKSSASLVPGFGPPAQGRTMAGFGSSPAAKPAATSSSASSSSPAPAATTTPSSESPSTASASPSSAGSPDRSQSDDRTRKFAEALLRQYDKNKNNVLEKDEWMQMKSTWRDSDANGDSIITLDELSAKIGGFSRSRPTASGNSSGSSGPAVSSGGGANTTSKKSYRFLSPHERLPGGLPDWFVRKDADGDGQVTMAEYSRSGWSDSMADEFVKYDRSGDGIITPEECLKAMNAK